jgi:hypothetical protein
MVRKSDRRAWFTSAVGGIITVPIWLWVALSLIFHVPSRQLFKPLLFFEILQIVMMPLFYFAWKRYESPSRDLRSIYAVCAAWCTVGLSILFRYLYVFGVFTPATNIWSLYEMVWIGVPLACLIAYFLAKRMYVKSGGQ